MLGDVPVSGMPNSIPRKNRARNPSERIRPDADLVKKISSKPINSILDKVGDQQIVRRYPHITCWPLDIYFFESNLAICTWRPYVVTEDGEL